MLGFSALSETPISSTEESVALDKVTTTVQCFGESAFGQSMFSGSNTDRAYVQFGYWSEYGLFDSTEAGEAAQDQISVTTTIDLAGAELTITEPFNSTTGELNGLFDFTDALDVSVSSPAPEVSVSVSAAINLVNITVSEPSPAVSIASTASNGDSLEVTATAPSATFIASGIAEASGSSVTLESPLGEASGGVLLEHSAGSVTVTRPTGETIVIGGGSAGAPTLQITAPIAELSVSSTVSIAGEEVSSTAPEGQANSDKQNDVEIPQVSLAAPVAAVVGDSAITHVTALQALVTEPSVSVTAAPTASILSPTINVFNPVASTGTAGLAEPSPPTLSLLNPEATLSLGATVSIDLLSDLNDSSELVTFVVTVQGTDGGNKYFIDGTQQAELDLKVGYRYRFDVSDSSVLGHPFEFSTTSNGIHGGGVRYTDDSFSQGSAGTSGSFVQIEPTDSTPSTLFYYCAIHSGMGGQLNVVTEANGILLENPAASVNSDQIIDTAIDDLAVSAPQSSVAIIENITAESSVGTVTVNSATASASTNSEAGHSALNTITVSHAQANAIVDGTAESSGVSLSVAEPDATLLVEKIAESSLPQATISSPTAESIVDVVASADSSELAITSPLGSAAVSVVATADASEIALTAPQNEIDIAVIAAGAAGEISLVAPSASVVVDATTTSGNLIVSVTQPSATEEIIETPVQIPSVFIDRPIASALVESDANLEVALGDVQITVPSSNAVAITQTSSVIEGIDIREPSVKPIVPAQADTSLPEITISTPQPSSNASYVAEIILDNVINVTIPLVSGEGFVIVNKLTTNSLADEQILRADLFSSASGGAVAEASLPSVIVSNPTASFTIGSRPVITAANSVVSTAPLSTAFSQSVITQDDSTFADVARSQSDLEDAARPQGQIWTDYLANEAAANQDSVIWTPVADFTSVSGQTAYHDGLTHIAIIPDGGASGQNRKTMVSVSETSSGSETLTIIVMRKCAFRDSGFRSITVGRGGYILTTVRWDGDGQLGSTRSVFFSVATDQSNGSDSAAYATRNNPYLLPDISPVLAFGNDFDGNDYKSNSNLTPTGMTVAQLKDFKRTFYWPAQTQTDSGSDYQSWITQIADTGSEKIQGYGVRLIGSFVGDDIEDASYQTILDVNDPAPEFGWSTIGLAQYGSYYLPWAWYQVPYENGTKLRRWEQSQSNGSGLDWSHQIKAPFSDGQFPRNSSYTYDGRSISADTVYAYTDSNNSIGYKNVVTNGVTQNVRTPSISRTAQAEGISVFVSSGSATLTTSSLIGSDRQLVASIVAAEAGVSTTAFPDLLTVTVSRPEVFAQGTHSALGPEVTMIAPEASIILSKVNEIALPDIIVVSPSNLVRQGATASALQLQVVNVLPASSDILLSKQLSVSVPEITIVAPQGQVSRVDSLGESQDAFFELTVVAPNPTPISQQILNTTVPSIVMSSPQSVASDNDSGTGFPPTITVVAPTVELSSFVNFSVTGPDQVILVSPAPTNKIQPFALVSDLPLIQPVPAEADIPVGEAFPQGPVSTVTAPVGIAIFSSNARALGRNIIITEPDVVADGTRRAAGSLPLITTVTPAGKATVPASIETTMPLVRCFSPQAEAFLQTGGNAPILQAQAPQVTVLLTIERSIPAITRSNPDSEVFIVASQEAFPIPPIDLVAVDARPVIPATAIADISGVNITGPQGEAIILKKTAISGVSILPPEGSASPISIAISAEIEVVKVTQPSVRVETDNINRAEADVSELTVIPPEPFATGGGSQGAPPAIEVTAFSVQVNILEPIDAPESNVISPVARVFVNELPPTRTVFVQRESRIISIEFESRVVEVEP